MNLYEMFEYEKRGQLGLILYAMRLNLLVCIVAWPVIFLVFFYYFDLPLSKLTIWATYATVAVYLIGLILSFTSIFLKSKK